LSHILRKKEGSEEMGEKRILSVALTGSWGKLEQNPNIPMTPQQIAEDAYQCYKAGAAIVHLHMRDENFVPKMDTERFRETIRLIRERCDVIINMTSSGDPIGTDEIRLNPLKELKPEIGSYDCGTMNWMHNSIFDNHPFFLEKLGLLMQEYNIKPELEIFDCGMLYNTFHYEKKGILKAPLHYQFVLGAPGGMTATVSNLVFLHSLLPEGATWSATGLSQGHIPILLTTLALGGHIRVGLEDNIYYSRGELATNVQLAERAVKFIELAGYDVATPDEARELLSISRR
jgi:uncharacterized protein (DUF849 family)